MWSIEVKENVLSLSTTSFKAEKGSVLHSGIYNRELASSLSAGAITILIGLFTAINYKITAVYYLAAALLFGALFIVLRSYVFKETVLELTLDKNDGYLRVKIKGIREKRQIFAISDITDVRLRHVTVQPENPDGIKVVENISLQHGTVIPGFGETEDFYVVELELKAGTSTRVFSSKQEKEAGDIAIRLRDFMKE